MHEMLFHFFQLKFILLQCKKRDRNALTNVSEMLSFLESQTKLLSF